MLCLGISVVIFCLIRLVARPAPSTMNKEYQEATNEYLRVRYAPQTPPGAYLIHFGERAIQWRISLLSADARIIPNRAKKSSRSPACLRKATRARAKCRANRSETDVAWILYFRHHLSAPVLCCLCNPIRCNIVFPFPPYTDRSIKEFCFRYGRTRELQCGEVWLWCARRWVGVFLGGRGGRGALYRKGSKTCAYRYLISRFHILLAFCSLRVSSSLTFIRPASYTIRKKNNPLNPA